jgi:hypothetical protein
VTTSQHNPTSVADARVTLPSPANRSSTLTLAELVDAFMASYVGRDTALCTRLAWWVEHLGDRPAFSITDDDVDLLMGALATTRGALGKVAM